jgi:tRNA pseudouridine55 synthase
MQSLERVAAGIFDIESALTPAQVDALATAGRLQEALIPLDAPLAHLPLVRVGDRCRHAVLNGNPLRSAWLSQPAPQVEAVRVYLNDEFAGIGAPQPNGDVKFRAMLYKPGDNG